MQLRPTDRLRSPVRNCGRALRRAVGWAVCVCLPASAQPAAADQPQQVTTQQSTSGADASAAPNVAVQPTQTAGAEQAAPQRIVAAGTPSAQVSRAQHARAERHYLHGAKQLESRDFAAAIDSFAAAASLDPARQEYVQALALAQEHRITELLQAAAQVRTSNPAEADRLLAQARGVDPQNPRVLQHDSTEPKVIAQLRLPSTRHPAALAGPVELQPAPGQHSFHLRGDRRELAKQIAASFGLQTALDPDLQARNMKFDLDDVDYPTAMQVFCMAAGTFTTSLEPHTVLVAQDTAANRTRLERLMEEVIPLPGYSAEQITDAANMVRSVFESAKVSFEPQIGAIAVRASADTLQAIHATLADLLETGSEVMIDVKLYSVNSEKVRDLGVTLPSSLGAFNVRSEAASIVSANQTLVNQLISNGVIPSGTSSTVIAAYLVFVAGLGTSSNLKNTFLLLGGGLTQTGLTAGSFPVLNLALRQSDARELDDVQLRLGDRVSSTVKSGTRYPIQTSLFSDVATSTTSSLAGVSVNGVSLSSLLSQYLGTNSLSSSAVVPQIQYEDLGLVLKAQSHVERGGEIALHLEIKITALAGAALNGIPVLASRQFSSDMTVQDGETALISSNVTESELRAASGIPGLNELPGFQAGTNRLTDVTRGNLVLLLTPHIVRYAHRSAKGPYLPIQPRPDTE